jgi:hypothetical protein
MSKGSLSGIIKAYNSDKFLRNIEQAILDSLEHDHMHLGILRDFLAKSLLSDFSDQYLRPLPARLFARGFFNWHKNDIKRVLLSDPEIITTVQESINTLSNDLVLNAGLLNNTDESEGFLKFLYRTVGWKSDIDAFLEALRICLKKHKVSIDNNLLNSKNTPLTQNNIRKMFFRDTMLSNDISTVLNQVVQRTSNRIIRKCLETHSDSLEFGRHSNRDYGLSYVSKQIASTIYDKGSPTYALSANFFIHFLSESIFSSFVDILGLRYRPWLKKR